MSVKKVLVKFNRVEIFGDEWEVDDTIHYTKFMSTDGLRTLTDRDGIVYKKVGDTYYGREGSSKEHGIEILKISKYKKSIHRDLIRY
jgi:hypothetical protein